MSYLGLCLLYHDSILLFIGENDNPSDNKEEKETALLNDSVQKQTLKSKKEG